MDVREIDVAELLDGGAEDNFSDIRETSVEEILSQMDPEE